VSEAELWRRAFCTYTKEPGVLQAWVEHVERVGPERAVEEAVRHIRAYGDAPDGVTLGFSPQVLVAAATVRRMQGREAALVVVTSPEVLACSVKAAELSHRVLALFRESGLVKSLYTSLMAPSRDVSVDRVLSELTGALLRARSDGVRVLDISGGTQLVPVVAMRAGLRRLTYTYPDGEYVVVYGFEV